MQTDLENGNYHKIATTNIALTDLTAMSLTRLHRKEAGSDYSHTVEI
jgi:hypothetical protein